MLAAHNRVSGSVGIDAVVDKQGHVKQVSAVRGNPLLTEAAKQAVLKWRYEPATIDGEPVESQVTITVRFAGAEK
jgi:protein TonB